MNLIPSVIFMKISMQALSALLIGTIVHNHAFASEQLNSKAPQQLLSEVRSMVYEKTYRLTPGTRELINTGKLRDLPSNSEEFGSVISNQIIKNLTIGDNGVAIVVFDKEAYQRLQSVSAQSELAQESRCFKQGKIFLDSLVQDKRVFSKSDFSRFEELVMQLIRQQNLDATDEARIDKFMDQKVKVVQIDFKSLLNRQTDCDAVDSLNVNYVTSTLVKQIKDSSVEFEGASLAHIPFEAFDILKSQTGSGAKGQLKVDASQARMMIYQAKILKKLKEEGFIDFERKSGPEMKDEQVYLKIKDKGLRKFAERADLISKYHNPQIQKRVGQSYFGAGLTSLMMSAFLTPNPESGGLTAISGGFSFISGTYLSTIASDKFVAKYEEGHQPELWMQMRSELTTSQKFNEFVNQKVLLTEKLFGLMDNKEYLSRRTQEINLYKADLANTLLFSALKGRDDSSVQKSYADHLVQSGVLGSEQMNEMDLIIRFLASNRLSAVNVDKVQMGSQHAEAILSMIAVLKAESAEESDLKELNDLENRVSKEIEFLKVLGK